MYYIIDRFEEDFAVCEDSQTRRIINIEKYKIPTDAKKGDVLILVNNKYVIDENKTEERKKIIHEKTQRLWK